MEIDRLAAVIRPRTPWEGLDLGFVLARLWFPALLGLWCVTALPIALFGGVLLKGSPDLWLLLVWWFKPLYEAPLVFWLSRRLFGESLGVRDLWRARRQVFPLRLLPNLLWLRLHPSRSLQFPILILEGLEGKARRQRQRVLQGTGGTGIWLTIICVHLESVLWLSGLLLVAIMIPDGLPKLDLSASVLEQGSTPYWVSTLIYWLAMAAMAPFYVAAGFALYLARRTELEAWDLELVFRRVEGAPRHRGRHRAQTGVVAMAMLAASLAACLPSPAQGLELSREQAKEEIEAVLASKEFKQTREIEIWVYAGGEDASEDSGALPDWLLELLRGLGRGGEMAAIAFKWLLFMAGGVLVLFVLRRVLRDLHRPRRAPSAQQEAPMTVTLAPRTKIELPADILKEVEARIGRDDLRGALSLLYAASIDLLQRRYGLKVKESTTEFECLALVLGQLPADEGNLMGRLVRAWQRLAYGHCDPAPKELGALIHDWRRWESGGRGN